MRKSWNSDIDSQSKIYTIWLTRPAGQSDKLAAELEAGGKTVLQIPMLEIEELPSDDESTKRIVNLDRYDVLIYISTNAARIGLELINKHRPEYPEHIVNFAPGSGTAAVLEHYGLKVLYPTETMSSEALISLPQFQQELASPGGTRKKVLIVRGSGGRETLANYLKQHGIPFDYLELYRRRKPDYDSAWLSDCLKKFFPDAIVISSAEALNNFVGIFGNMSADFSEVRFFVSSPVLKSMALDAGFKQVIEMKNASDGTISDTLLRAENLNHD